MSIERLAERDRQLARERERQAANRPRTDMTGLAAVLAKLETVIVDDEAVAERERGIAQREADRASAERALRIARSGIGLDPKSRAAIVSGALDLEFGKSMRAVVRWLGREDVPSVLVLRGGTGAGKTVAAGWALARRGGYLRSVSQIVWTWQSNTVRAIEERERLAGCELLVIDDVGTEKKRDTEALVEALRDLLELRQREGARTLVTTNLSREAWLARYPDERVESRLSRAAWVTDSGIDHRRAGATKP